MRWSARPAACDCPPGKASSASKASLPASSRKARSSPGLGEAVLEKNRDARLLSPGALLDASLGERLHLRRTVRATGKVREQDAIVRATAGRRRDPDRRRASRRCAAPACPKPWSPAQCPPGLSAKPTLSVRVRSPQPVERDVTLSYITNNFDWQANYVAELSPAGDRMSLFAWLTLANGDQTGLADAQTQAVAGKLNRAARLGRRRARPSRSRITCWPQGTTSDIPRRASPVTLLVGQRYRRHRRGLGLAATTAARRRARRRGHVMAQEERLGDVRLYRIPERSPSRPNRKSRSRCSAAGGQGRNRFPLRPPPYEFEADVERVLVTRNRSPKVLGCRCRRAGSRCSAARGPPVLSAKARSTTIRSARRSRSASARRPACAPGRQSSDSADGQRAC